MCIDVKIAKVDILLLIVEYIGVISKIIGRVFIFVSHKLKYPREGRDRVTTFHYVFNMRSIPADLRLDGRNDFLKKNFYNNIHLYRKDSSDNIFQPIRFI